MDLRVLGCGDAFGSGGRFNTCFHVTTSSTQFLVDCGASSLVAMRRFGVEPNAISTVFLTHLHGDHFGGLPFLILDAQFVSRRASSLTVAGPPGLKERLGSLMEAMFPGSSTIKFRFVLELVEMAPERQIEINGVCVMPFQVIHPSGAPSFALRLTCEGKVLCYTGDTEWVDTLIPAARDADLLIAEAYTAERSVRYHLDWTTLQQKLPLLAPKSLLLTHMGSAILDHRFEGYEAAEDGRLISF